jgi:hypothetical protein
MPSTEQRIIDMAAYSKVTKDGEGKNHKIQLDVYVDLHTNPRLADQGLWRDRRRSLDPVCQG